MKINNLLLQDYITNASDILYLLRTKTIKRLLNKISNEYIEVKNKKIHVKPVTKLENFIFILDQYIYFIKQNIFIDPLELRFLIELSLDNNKSDLLLTNKYFLDNKSQYKIYFEKIFTHNFFENQKIIKRNVNNIKVINNFFELCNLINNNKDNYYILFEKISDYNLEKIISMWITLN